MLDAVVIAVPVQERRRAHDFYVAALGLEAFGDLADDGLPEPLRLRLTAGAMLMCVPRGGFGWVVGDREVAGDDQAEVLLSFTAADPAGVDAAVDRAVAAGATVVTAPSQQPWGYEGTFSDPDGHLWSVLADPAGS